MENRLAPATVTVTTTADELIPNDGSVSLREAITSINAGNNLGDPDIIAQNPGMFGFNDNIQFNIPGTGVHTILVGSSGLGRLPAISAPVLINGSSQPGFSSTPLIELDGAAAGANAAGLELRGGNCNVVSLAINRFTGDGLWLDTNGGDAINNCFIGTNAKGTLVLSNFGNGVFIDNVANNSLTGNLIGGSGNNGILIQGAGATLSSIGGNRIGTNGTLSLSNNLDGVLIDSAPNNTLSGNTIAANGANGVHILGASATGNSLNGNVIGIGSVSLGNNLDGVLIENAPNNTLTNNSIAANSANGVHVLGSSATGNDLESNRIGLAGEGNSANGVFIEGAPANKIGSGSAHNVIIANGNDGILIQGSAASGNTIQENFIGTDQSTSMTVGNLQDGIHIDNAPNNVIGGMSAGFFAGNTIAGNDGDGAFIGGAAAVGNQVAFNSIGVVQMPPSHGFGNQGNGVTINGASGTTIVSGDIVANGNNGVLIVGATATNNRVQSNVAIEFNKNDGIRIDSAPNNSINGVGTMTPIQENGGNGIHIMGTGANGNVIQGVFEVALNALYGIVLEGPQVQNNMIGGTNPGEGNVIGDNGLGGVAIFGNQNTGNAILGNNIGDPKSGLGIDLVTGTTYPTSDGVTRPNTLGGPHVGPNNLQNFPVLLSATPLPPGPGQISAGERVHGYLNSTPNTTFRLEFFWHHQGNRTFLGAINVMTNAQGNVTFTADVTTPGAMGPPSAAAGELVDATATDSGNNTSEFSREIRADFGADLVGRVAETGQWWLSQSTGSSLNNQLWTSWDHTITWVDVQTGGFTGDARTDIAGRDLSTGNWWVGVSNGSSFTNQLWTTWSTAVTWVDVKVGDFNGDGKADIAGRVKETGQWWVALSNGSSFTNQLWTTWATGVTWVDVNVGDFNGDGKADIAGRALESGQWWLAVSTGSNFTNQLWATWSTAVNWLDVKVGDFNGDTLADIAGRADQSGQWWIALSTGSSFTNQLWTTWSTSVTWVDVVIGDFNGDGQADIAGRALESGQWWVALSTGTSFTNQLWTVWSTGVNWSDIRVGDFNDDGKTDIAGREVDNGQWWVAVSTGGAFTNQPWGVWSPMVTWVNVATGRF